MPQVVVETYTHKQTGKVHIVNVSFPGQMWHCYCSLLRREEPVEMEIDLEDVEVCSTCAQAYVEDHPEEVSVSPEELETKTLNEDGEVDEAVIED